MSRKMKSLLILLFALTLTGLSACGGTGLPENEREQSVKKVEKLETAEYKLLNFQMDYAEYLSAVDGIVSETYMQTMSDRIIFGYNEKEYRASDMMKMSAAEYEKHKEYMQRWAKSLGVDKEKTTIRVSEPYVSKEGGEAFVYTEQSADLNGKTLTRTNRKYSLEKADGTWTVTGVEQDNVTIGINETETDAAAKLDSLKYQTHEGVKINYRDKVLEFNGWE